MGTFLAKNIQYKDGIIKLYGATSNIRPLSFNWSSYEVNKPELFFYDLIAGTVKFKYSNGISDIINKLIESIETIHKEKYPMGDENYCIGDYSLYSMLKTHKSDKENTLNQMVSNLDIYIECYREEKRQSHKLYTEKWDEFSSHVEDMFQLFLKFLFSI